MMFLESQLRSTSRTIHMLRTSHVGVSSINKLELGRGTLLEIDELKTLLGHSRQCRR